MVERNHPHRGQKNQGNQLPTATEAERGLIGSLLVDPAAFDRVAGIVAADDFLDQHHAATFRVCAALRAEGQAIDCALVLGRLREAQPEHANAAELFKLARDLPHAAHAVYYAEQIREVANKRRLAIVANDLHAAALNGTPAAEALASARVELEQIESRGNRRGRFELLTAAELAATPLDIPYLVQGALAEGQPCLVTGGSKTLKTSVLVDLALSLATGGHWMGYFPVVRQARTLVMSGESGRATLAETAARIARAAGRDLASIDGLTVCDSLPRLASAADVAELGRVITGEAISCLIVDPAYLAMDLDGREGSLFAVGAQLRPLSEVCQRAGCTLIVAHHAKQGTAREFGPPQLGDASWAGFEQFARQWILLKRREAYTPGTGEHRLWLSTGGSAGHGGSYHLDVAEGTRETAGGRFWQVNVSPAAEAAEAEQVARQQARETQAAQTCRQHADRITALLATFTDGETANVLKTALGMSGQTWGQAIAMLLDCGAVETCQVRKGNRDHAGFRLTRF